MEKFTVNGQVYNVKPEDVENFLSKYPKAERKSEPTLIKSAYGEGQTPQFDDDINAHNIHAAATNDPMTDEPEDKGFFEDIYTSYQQGKGAGTSVNEAFDVYKHGASISDEKLQAYLDAVANMDQSQITNEQYNFQKAQEKYGGGIYGTLRGMYDNPGYFPQMLVTSLATMGHSVGDSDEVAGYTAAGAGLGATAGFGVGSTGFAAGPLGILTSGGGAITGGLAGGMTGLVGAMETGLTLTDLLKQELEGKPFTKENIRGILEDPDAIERIKSQSVRRGVAIGAVEGLTLGLSRGVGSTMLRAGKSASRIAAATTGLEMGGGFVGEVAGQAASGQEIDLGEATLESIGEAKGVIAVGDIIAKATGKQNYKINGELRSKKDIRDFLNSPNTTPADIAKANLEVTNDNNFSEFVDSKVNDAVLETQVDSKISDIRDVKEMVDLEKKRQKAEADSKKKGINMVPDAKETLEQTEARMEEIRLKYSKVDGRTKDVRAREKTKGEVLDVIVDKQFKSGLEFARKHSKLYNLEFDDTMTAAEIAKKYGKEAAKSNGFIKDGKIIVNSQVAKLTGIEGSNVANHELLHGIIKASGAKIKQPLIKDFLNKIGADNKAVIDKRIKDNYDADYMKKNKDEYFTIFSDAIESGDIKFDNDIFTQVKDVVRNILQDLGLKKVDFKTADGLYNFLKDYNRSIHKGALSQGLARDTKGDGAIKGMKTSLSAIDSKKINDIYNEDGLAGWENMEGLLKPTAVGLANRYRNRARYNEFKDILVDEIMTGRRGMLDIIMDYDTKKKAGQKMGELSGYINNSFSTKTGFKRHIEIADRILGKDEGGQFIASLDSPDTFAEAVAEDPTPRRRIKESPGLNPVNSLDNKLKKDHTQGVIDNLPNLDLDNINFKNLPDLTPEVTAKHFNVPVKKIVDATANLSKQDLVNSSKALNKIIKTYNKIMPKGAVLEGASEKLIGTSTGLAKSILDAFYTKGARSTKGAGIYPYALNDISEKFMLQKMGIDSNGAPVDGLSARSPEAQLQKAMMKLWGKLMTNSTVRQELTNLETNINTINDIAAGKNPLQYSKSKMTGIEDGLSKMNIFSPSELKSMKTEFAAESKRWKSLLKTIDEGIEPLDSKNPEHVVEFKHWLRNVGSKELSSDILNVGTLANAGKAAAERNFFLQSADEIKETFKGKKLKKGSDNIRAAVKRESYVNLKDKIGKKEFQKSQDQSIQGLKEIFLQFQNLIKKDKNNIKYVAAMLAGISNSQNHFMRTAAPIRFYDVTSGTMVQEHTLPASVTAKALFRSAVNGTVNKDFNNIKKNYYQGSLAKTNDKKLKGFGPDGRSFSYVSRTPLGWEIKDNVLFRYFNQNVANVNGGINPRNIIWQDGKSVFEKFNINSSGVEIPVSLVESQLNMNNVNIDKVKETNNLVLSKSKDINDFIPKHDEAIKRALDPNKKPKGISVFDFDDTLARTNSKIVVTMPGESLVYNASPKTFDQLGKRTGLIFLATDIKEAQEYAKSNRGKVREISINDSSLATEDQVLDAMKNLNIDTSEGLLYEMIDSRFKDFYIGDANLNKLKKALKQRGFGGFKYNDGSQLSSKGTESVAIIDKSIIKQPTKINATKFAKEHANLEAAGANFDFSEFNKVVDGKKGPLADLAIKRQGKFGSKDIFVLTARPQESANAIHAFLKGMGLEIPMDNITGLEDGRPAAKANWIIEKYSEGYNDFYFADDAYKNVKAVRDVLGQLDVKSDVQQAKIKFSKSLNNDFQKMIEETTGVEAYKTFSRAAAKSRGVDIGKWKIFLPPSAQDFMGLMYPLFGKGKMGERHKKLIDDALNKPYWKAMRDIASKREVLSNDYNALKRKFPGVKSKLGKETGVNNFSYDNAVRVYLWDRSGFDIPGMSKTDLKKLTDIVKNDKKLLGFATELSKITRLKDGYPQPENSWYVGTTASDMFNLTQKVKRKDMLAEWNANKEIIFSEENLNKLEAILGSNWRNAMEDILYRMENGTNRNFGDNKLVNGFQDWINGSVGATMFFNMRSAVLQTISFANYINWSDNNPLKVGMTLANQPQFWTDFMKLFNSDMLKQRRGGLQMDVNQAEIAQAVQGSKNKYKAGLAYLLQNGFIPTRYADSFAISFGGASMYRNRVNTYLNQGLTKAEAETKAFDDFQQLTEEAQQSSNPAMISPQQAGPLGRLILAWQNTPMQYTRMMQKALSDIANNRGDLKTNVSKIIYYGAIQNLMFTSLQAGLFAMMFDEDQEEGEYDKKKDRVVNNMLDTVLRGSGVYGAVVSTVKNMVMKFMEQEKKGYNADHAYTMIEAVNLSPPLGSKARKIYGATQSYKFNRDIIVPRGFNIDNPGLDAVSGLVEATTNIPLNNTLRKLNNYKQVANKEHEAWQRIAMAMGWNMWDVGVRNPELEDLKEEVKKNKKKKKKENKKKEEPKKKEDPNKYKRFKIK
tara:strand:+ start:15765 stop:23066 length:7302 start_codon:yes stop_codon:yes gene_type:complete